MPGLRDKKRWNGVGVVVDRLFSLFETERSNKNKFVNIVSGAKYNSDKPSLKTKGEYEKGFPEGAVIHYTAGRQDASAEATIEYARSQGHCYIVIDAQGNTHQQFDISRWGYHAGRSHHPRLGSYLSRKLVGIELTNPGKLQKVSNGEYRSWFGEHYFDSDDVQWYSGIENIQPGYYLPFTKYQQLALVDLLYELKLMAPEVFFFENVLGHDEISPDRKTDPGGSLTMTMSELRDLMHSKWQEQFPDEKPGYS